MDDTRNHLDPRATLGIAENRAQEPVHSPWVDRLLALGTRLARNIEEFIGDQLIIAISVPSREYAATLVGVGWLLGRPPTREPRKPLDILRGASPGERFRAVIGNHVVSAQFRNLDEDRVPPRVYLAGQWEIDRIEAIAPIAELDLAEKMDRPDIGSIGRRTKIDQDWAWRLVAPSSDLAIVGTKSRLDEDMQAILTWEGDQDGDSLETLLLPQTEKSATWFSRIYSSSHFAHHLPLPREIYLAILDGSGAITHVNDVLSPIVVCILDRSVADESAVEQLVQLRNSHGEPISLKSKLGWSPPTGIESFGFTMKL